MNPRGPQEHRCKGAEKRLGEGDVVSLHNPEKDGLEEGGREFPRKSATDGLDEPRLLIEEG
jgi:hypothetical protein